MKRFHVHVSVEDLGASIRFYATVFGGPPTVRKVGLHQVDAGGSAAQLRHPEPRGAPGLDHLGLQVDTDDELRVTEPMRFLHLSPRSSAG
jgi:catechol 2,3-dioxygenase-like lactoylglutathione lyase family enzyme